MDWNTIFNWPGIALCVSAISAAWYFVKKEMLHRRNARFEIAMSKIYSAIERFICAANTVRVNINTMPLDLLLTRKSGKMDEWITIPIFEMENIALLTEMFFNHKDRGCFDEMVIAARDFKLELHKASSATVDSDKLNIYDTARVAFNKKYNSGMSNMVEMLHRRLLGEWEYDLTGLRLNTSRQKQVEHKRNQ